MLSRARTAIRFGVEARLIEVEVDVAPRGIASFRVLGAGPSLGRVLEHRLKTALRNRGLPWPSTPVTVNLSPAGLPQEAAGLDLAVAVACLAAQGLVDETRLADTVLLGELRLDGSLRPVPGALAAAEATHAAGLARLACPPALAAEAALVEAIKVHALSDLGQAVAWLRGEDEAIAPSEPREPSASEAESDGDDVDLAEVRGHGHARRALEIAAAGRHGLLLVGPPGSGKSLLARRLPTILPPLMKTEALEVTRVHSAAGLLLGAGSTERARRRPFRSPHHGVSTAALLGGGKPVAPGELTLAHRGVLFLDELPEFRRDALESLRQPLEDGVVEIARTHARLRLPCATLLIAAMNPCPCGWVGSPRRPCACSDTAVHRYRRRVSGPLLDRLDLQVHVPALSHRELTSRMPSESSVVVRARVEAARRRQLDRQGCPNGELRASELHERLVLDDESRRLLAHAVDGLGLSARAHDRVLRVALTIQDLEAGATAASWSVTAEAVAEALAYRHFDRLGGVLAP
ncbi:MAG: YifB family Mg chelatase-like AAA ATPase [Acidobacteriota bacterium]